MIKLFSCPLGCGLQPFGFQKKCNPLAIALQAAGSIGQGISNIISTNNTNNKNYQIHQEQLAAQRKQYEDEVAENRFLVNQQRRWSLEDRDFENEYNSPKAVKQRLIAAGINPAFAMANGQNLFGSATAETSTGTNPTSSVPQAPQMVVPDYSAFGQGISDAVARYYQAKDSERADFALASDITFRNRQSLIDYMKVRNESINLGISRDRLMQEDEHFMKSFGLEESKVNRQLNLDEARTSLEARRVAIDETRLQIDKDLADQNIRLSKTQQKSILQDIQESAERIIQMKKNGASDRDLKDAQKREAEALKAYYGQQKINLKNEDLRNWLRMYLESSGSIVGSRFPAPIIQHELQEGYFKNKRR